MEFPDVPFRCPECDALVVDRRSPVCTTCRAELPKEWVLTPEEIAKINALDQDSRAEHASSMEQLDAIDPNRPLL